MADEPVGASESQSLACAACQASGVPTRRVQPASRRRSGTQDRRCRQQGHSDVRPAPAARQCSPTAARSMQPYLAQAGQCRQILKSNTSTGVLGRVGRLRMRMEA
eukprot:1933029-Prymnesium_polylepis.1